MPDEIPPDFGKPWDLSDITLVTLNSDDKLLHVNRVVLSVFSPMLRAMFSEKYIESKQSSVEVSADYNAMVEILRIIFHVNRDFSSRGNKSYTSIEIADMYRAADYLDIALIRKLCLDQISERPSIDMAMAALELDLHDVMMATLEKLASSHVTSFLSGGGNHRTSQFRSTDLLPLRCFSKNDIPTVYARIIGNEISSICVSPGSTISLKDISTEIKNERIDITKKWFASNVTIQTKNAPGLLYANKGTLAAVSEYFRQLFFDENMTEKEKTDKNNTNSKLLVRSRTGKRIRGRRAYRSLHTEKELSVLQLDVEYVTMKTVLSLVHFCNKDFAVESQTLYHPVLLYDMYRISTGDQLDIPIIQSLCAANLLKQPTLASAEVAVKLGLGIQYELLQLLDLNTFQQWLHCSDRNLVYLNDGKEVVISVKRTDQVLSVNDVRLIIDRLKNNR